MFLQSWSVKFMFHDINADDDNNNVGGGDIDDAGNVYESGDVYYYKISCIVDTADDCDSVDK